MAELFVELMSEEIPAKMQQPGASQLGDKLKTLLDGHALGGAPARVFSTPRRLVCVIDQIRGRQADRIVERRGPRVDAPARAREGFLRSLGDAGFTLGEIDDKKGRFLVARVEQNGRDAGSILAEEMPGLLHGFVWPKSMRWGARDAQWVRPLRRIVCSLDGTIVPFEFAGIRSDQVSQGHRFMAPEPFEVREFDHYADALARRHVLLDAGERRAAIEREASALATARGLKLKRDDRLLDELAGLVEWPVPILGGIDAKFMELPDEVLITSMREHQKFLALEDEDGALAPFFVTVANLPGADGGAAIRAGNEYVLRARLWDARFFWNQDRKKGLEGHAAQLDDVVFHAELGTLGDKVRRLEVLAQAVADRLGFEPAPVQRAARLAKADLMTGMVGEFPELQGQMGYYYARHGGETDEVAQAIRDHYRPQGPADRCSSAPASVALALTDKIDTLIGFFSAGMRPTGSKDPFALRRAALGVIRLLVENNLRLRLLPVFAIARDAYGERFETDVADGELMGFLLERLKVHLRGQGVRHDLIDAALAGPVHDDVVNLIDRVSALDRAMTGGDGLDLLAACKRAMNILAIEEKRDGAEADGEIDQSMLVVPAEQELAATALEVENRVHDAMAAFDIATALRALGTLRDPMDRFFDEVMVNDPDAGRRRNRLRLLALVRRTANNIAAISMIEDHVREGTMV